MKNTWIASAELIVVSASGAETPVVAGIGTPYLTPERQWRCPAQLTGLHDRLADMAGEDSLQALCMAASLIHHLLAGVVADGGSILSAADRSEYPLEAVFGRIGSSRPTSAA